MPLHPCALITAGTKITKFLLTSNSVLQKSIFLQTDYKYMCNQKKNLLNPVSVPESGAGTFAFKNFLF